MGDCLYRRAYDGCHSARALSPAAEQLVGRERRELFRIKRGAVKVESIRAAALTQTLGGLSMAF